MKKKYESVRIFRTMLVLFMALALVVFVVIIPVVFRNAAGSTPILQPMQLAITGCSWLVGLPIVLALWIGIRVCRELYQADDFTRYTAAALRQIGSLACAEAAIVLGCGMALYFVLFHNLLILLLAIVLMLGAFAAFVFCRVLARIVDNALDIKEENELTI